jgi:hypothetical protein
MHECNYCSTIYEPRSQVKNPKACNKKECQRARQRDNERDWREKNKAHYEKDYFEQQRAKRDSIIKDTVADVARCIEVGKQFLSETGKLEGFNLDKFKDALEYFFSALGIRNINKFWIPIIAHNYS